MKKTIIENKFIILSLLFSIFLFVAVSLFQKNFTLVPNGEMTDNQLKQVLGDISMGEGIRVIEYSYTNFTDEAIFINNFYTSCMCTKAKIQIDDEVSAFAGMKGHKSGLMPINPQMTLNPGKTAVITAEFDPNAHGPDAVGPINRSIFMHTDNKEMPVIEFIFSGEVIK